MLGLLMGGDCYTPDYIGKKDILIAFDKVCAIEDNIPQTFPIDIKIYDCKEKMVIPGIIDQHVHLTGGGGESGPASRVPEIMLGDLITAGVTTAVGVLGVDGITRSMETLLAKADALESEGISTYIYTGSYSVPTATLMGKPIKDIALIRKVIGIGEVALADSRSSYPTVQQMKELSYEALVGGMLGGKAGVVHIHVGDGKDGLSTLFRLIEETDYPVHMFVPTHLNRKEELFEQAIQYAKAGGNIDLTAGETSDPGITIPDAFQRLLGEGINIERITFSSDGNGSMPYSGTTGSNVGKVAWLLDDVVKCVRDKSISLEIVIKAVTSNVARLLKLYPGKGTLMQGSSADILVLNRDLTVNKLFSMGNLLIDDGKVIKKGKYE